MHRSVLALTTLVALATPAPAQMIEASFPPPAGIDDLGLTVALDGTRGVAGAETAGVPQPRPGRAIVFERTESSWTTVAELAVPGATPAYAKSVAIDGDVAVIGDAGALAGSLEAASAVGAVHVFTFDGNAWLLTQTLQSGVVGDGFGRSVAVHGETLVVGAPDAPAAASTAQPTRVFRRLAGVWTKTQDLVGVDSAPDDRFGDAVDLFDDLLVVGAPDDLFGSGSAYVFEEVSGSFVPTQKLNLGPLAGTAAFGDALSVHGERVLIGAPEWNGAVGAALLYAKQPGLGWSHLRTFQRGAAFAAHNDRFGVSVDLRPGRVAIGVPGESPGGAVYFGVEDPPSWPLHRIEPVGGPFSAYGFSVALAGDRVAAGLPVLGATGLLQVAYCGLAGEVLDASTDAISVASGGTQVLSLDLPSAEVAGDTFLLLGSLSGDAPGVPLPNGGTLALNPDPYFFFSFANPTAGLLAPGIGTLNGAGNAESAVVVPAGAFPSAVGLTLHHAAVTLQPGTFEVTGATNAVPLTFVP
ncbi:MAG: hypothetical protein ACF8XB_21120 [Planctomycetota bacterium JB042]